MKTIISKSMMLTIAVIIINFGFKIYLSYHISKEDIGLFYTSIDIVSVASLFFTGYKDSMIKVFAEGNFFVVKNYIFRQYLIMVLVFLPILYLLFKNYQDINILYSVTLFLLFFVVSQISNYYSYLNVAHRNYNSMLYEKSIKAIGLILSFIVLMRFYSLTTALILAYIVQLSIHIIYIKITSPHIYFLKVKDSDIKIYKKFLKNFQISTITSFFGSINIYLSAIILFYLYADSDTLAQYQVVVKSIFFALVTVFVHPITAYTFPELSKLIAQKSYDEVKIVDSKIHKYLGIFFILTLFSTLFTEWGITLIFPSDYNQSYKMLNILLPLLPFIAYTSFAINIIKGFDYFDLALMVRIGGSIIFFVSIYLFYLFGFDATSIVYSLDLSFFGMFLHAYYYKKRLLK